MYVLIFSLLFCLNLYAQCDDYSYSQCNNDNSCEWVVDIEYGHCEDILIIMVVEKLKSFSCGAVVMEGHIK